MPRVRGSSFFFFQAEDGIRDLTVTGVQTCALPICPRGQPVLLLVWGGHVRRRRAAQHHEHGGAVSASAAARRGRSGERRVGEEGRSRGGPDHLKKKKEK